MRPPHSPLGAGKSVTQIAGGLIVRDFLEILDPRLTRKDIANARKCDKMPLVGLEPATLDLSAQTLTQLTKWSGGVDFLRAGAMAKFHDAIQTKGGPSGLNRL